MLTALPSLSGAILRVPYSFMVPIFGGRNWTVLSTVILIIPCVWLGIAIQNTATPYWVFIVIALLCGFAGANFASSMGNISFSSRNPDRVAHWESTAGWETGRQRNAVDCATGHFSADLHLSGVNGVPLEDGSTMWLANAAGSGPRFCCWPPLRRLLA